MSDISTAAHDLKAEVKSYLAGASSANHIKFATVWPTAREGLVVLQALVPAGVRMFISIVLSVGDTLLGSVAVPAPAAA